jgi:succinate-acetate transporter protein
VPVEDGPPRHVDVTRIFLRPIGSGLPLGFFAFGIGMLLLACSALKWIPVAETQQVGMLLMAFVFPLELIATIFAFLARDTLGAATLGLFTASWLALGWIDVSGTPGARSVAVGVFLFGFAAAALMLALLSMQGKPFFAALLSLAVGRMAFSGAFEAGATQVWNSVAGGFGLALTVLALYGGTALGLEDAKQRELLPLFRRGAARQAFEGYDAQLQRLESEPGVRQQL